MTQIDGTLSSKQKLFSVLPTSIFILVNIFLFGPLTIYQSNYKEIGYPFLSIIMIFLYPSLIIVSILSVFGVILADRSHKRYVALLFVLGLLIWLQGNILVWKYGVFDGRDIDWSIEPWRGWVDGSIWLTLLTAAILLSKYFYRIAASGSIAMISLQFVLAGYVGITKPDIWISDYPEPGVTPNWATEFSSNKNVIQIILDALPSTIFEEIYKEDPEYYSTAFEGFTFFKEATGHFPSTHLSVPAILSGKIYQNQVPMSDYLEETYSGKTSVNVLHEHGYEVDLIPWSSLVKPGLAEHYYAIPSPYTGSSYDYQRLKSALMIDLVLFRHSPHILKRAIYNDQKWFIQRTTVQDERLQFRRFGDDAFLQDVTREMSVKREKPVYKLYHLQSTHAPFVTNDDCEYSGQTLPPNRANMLTQARCVMKTVISFLDKLKSVDIYNSSLIILQADHGYYAAPIDLKQGVNPTEGYELAPWMVSAALPLLLVKPPSREGPLNISVAPVMLTDIPATICAIESLEVTFPGKSVFDVLPTEVRERKFNHYRWASVNWDAEYLPPLDEFAITGSVFERSSWNIIQNHPSANSLSTNKINLGLEESARFLRFGWSYKEMDPKNEEMTFTWAVGESASIKVTLPKTQVRLTVNVRSPFTIGKQSVRVMVDGEDIGGWVNSKRAEWEKRSIFIRPDNRRPAVSIIEFVFSDHLEPSEGQPRRLALLFESITFGD